MPKFQIVKTVTYDVTAEVEADNLTALKEMLDKDGDSWVRYEQIDGTDEVVDIYEIEEANA